jgi:hypothetical protein
LLAGEFSGVVHIIDPPCWIAVDILAKSFQLAFIANHALEVVTMPEPAVIRGPALVANSLAIPLGR